MAPSLPYGQRGPTPDNRTGTSERHKRSHRRNSDLKSLFFSITRFLYLREVEGLLCQDTDRDEEALTEQEALVSSEAESEPVKPLAFLEEAGPSQAPSSWESALGQCAP